MEIIITAVGPDHKGLADPIVHHVTDIGANISEIQMFDHREEAIFAMMLRMAWDIQPNDEAFEKLRDVMSQIAEHKGLSIRVWSPDERVDKPNIAICVTHRSETPLAILQAIKSGELNANPAVIIGNRDTCKEIAIQNNIDWHNIGNEKGIADDEKMIELFDQYNVDYVALAQIHASLTCRKLLEVCRRKNHQLASRLTSQLSWTQTVPRCLFGEHVNIRLHMSLYHSRT